MSKTIIGKVTANSTDKTITVQFDRRKTHPVYQKQYTVSKKFLAHDENNEAAVGDTVEISSVAPISKRKTWKMIRIVEKAVVADEVSV